MIPDRDGNSVACTGNKCDGWSDHLTGDNYAIAENKLVGKETIKSMVRAFEDQTDLPLADRLLSSLEVGQTAGDKRGKQSAALLIVEKEEYPLLDLRVDDRVIIQFKNFVEYSQ